MNQDHILLLGFSIFNADLKRFKAKAATSLIFIESSVARCREIHKETGCACLAWEHLEDNRLTLEQRVNLFCAYTTDEFKKKFKKTLLEELLKVEKIKSSHLEHYLSLAQRTWINHLPFQELNLTINLIRACAKTLSIIYKIRSVICSNVPHELGDYILYEEVKYQAGAIERMCFYPSPIQGMQFLLKEKSDTSTTGIRSSKIKFKNEENMVIKKLEEYLIKLSASLSVNDNPIASIHPYSSEQTKQIKNTIDQRKRKGKKMLLSSEAGISYITSARDTKNTLNNLTTREIKKINCKGKLHLFSLHYEPEMTFMPACGTRFSTQADVVSYILSKIGESDILIVKEHPYQWTLHNIADGPHYLSYPDAYRSRMFYETIASDERVRFAETKVPSVTILKEFKVHLWSVNGTVSLESWMLGQEQTILGAYNPWRFLQNLHNNKSKLSTLKEELHSRLINTKVDLQILHEIITNASE